MKGWRFYSSPWRLGQVRGRYRQKRQAQTCNQDRVAQREFPSFGRTSRARGSPDAEGWLWIHEVRGSGGQDVLPLLRVPGCLQETVRG